MIKTWGDFYSNRKSDYASTYDLDFLIRNAACHLDFFKFIYAENPKKILEVGTGTGSMSIFLSYLGIGVTSLDNDRKVLENAKKLSKKLNGKVNFVFGDGFKMDFKNDNFDVVFHQGLLEHFEDEEISKLLNEQLRVAKTVVLSVPNNFYPIQDFGNERLLTKQYWDNLLSSNFHLVESLDYNPYTKTILGGRVIRRVRNTMYLAKIQKKK